MSAVPSFDEVYARYKPYAAGVAKHIHWRTGSRFPLDDMVADALVGLWKAIKDFQPGRDVPIGAYISERARGEVLDGLRRDDRFPRGHADRLRLQEKMVPDHLSIDVERLNDDGGHVSGLAAILLDPAPAIGRRLERRDECRRALVGLSREERTCMTLHFGEGLTQAEVARALGVSDSYVSLICAEAVRKVRRNARARS